LKAVNAVFGFVTRQAAHAVTSTPCGPVPFPPSPPLPDIAALALTLIPTGASDDDDDDEAASAVAGAEASPLFPFAAATPLCEAALPAAEFALSPPCACAGALAG
jgi:hypothetical protein